MKDNKPAVDLNNLLKSTYAKDVIEKWLNSVHDRYNLEDKNPEFNPSLVSTG